MALGIECVHGPGMTLRAACLLGVGAGCWPRLPSETTESTHDVVVVCVIHTVAQRGNDGGFRTFGSRVREINDLE